MRSLLFAALLLSQSSNPAQVQTGTITGRLLALDGRPAAGVRVSAMPAGDPAKPSATSGSDGTVLASLTQTDTSGRYRLENVPPGRYYVLAGFVDSPTYFPGVTTNASATAVSVAARATVSGIDFQAARLSTGLNLKGRLKRDSNEGVGGLNIFLSGGDQYPNARSLPDGSFEFLKLKPGSYTISVSTPNFPPQQIVLTDKDVSNLEFVIPWTVDVTGTVSVEGGGMRPNLNLTFAGGTRGMSSTSARESFRITLPEGAYAIAANGLPAGFFIKSIKAGTTDLLSEPLKLSRTSPPPAIAVTLGVSTPPPWVKLSGRVTGLPSSSTTAPRIILNGPVSETLQATLGVDGSFEFPKLLPGNYSVNINPTSVSLPPSSIIVPNFDLEGVRIIFPAVREISGRVSVEDDGPLPLANLSLTGTFGMSVESDKPTLAQLLVTSTQPRNSINVPLNVQKDGTFKASLPEGQYRITANSQPRNANGSLYVVKAFTYGTTDLTRDTVSVTTADSASMNLTFGPTSPIAWSKVTGRVTGLDSSFLAANSLVVTLNGSGLVTNWTSAVMPDGSFEFPKVYPGTYTARITPPNPASAGNLNFGLATATINPSGSDITGLEIAVPRQKDIVGKLTLDGRGLMPRFVIPLAPVAGTSSPQAQYMGIDPKPDGSFTISVLEGTRQVGVPNNLPAGYTLKSMTYGTTDVLKNPMKVAMSDTAELRVTLTTPNLAPVHVGGRLTGVDDAIFARGAVTATMRGIGNIASLTTPVRPDRSFDFPEVFPGTYSVRVAGAGIVNSPDVPVAVASSDLTNIEIAVPRQKEITGRVILEGLAPMPRFQFLTPPSAPTAGLVSSSPVSTPVMLINPQTDGTFRLTLTVGTHYTGAAIGLPAGYTIKSFNYGTTDLLKNPLKVGANDTDELLITLTTPARPPVQVRGHVGGLDEATFARGDVNVSMASASYVSPVNTLVMKDGSFEFQDVFPGNYLARATGPGVRSLSNVSVNVRNTDIQNVEITVPSQKEVTGRVILEGSGPMPRITLLLAPSSDTSTLVLLQNANISPIAAPTGGIITLPDPIPGPIPGPTLIAANGLSIAPLPDGTFRLAIPEGEQRLGSVNGLPPGYTLKELNYGTTDVLKNPLKIAASDNFEIRAVVTTSNPKPVRVSGRVIGLDNASFDRGSVNMTMASPTYAAPLNAKIQPDGTFEFSEVYPGNFSLRVMGASLSTSSNPMISVANANVDNLEIRVSPLKLVKGHVSIKDGGPYPVLLFLPIAPASTTSTRPEMDGTFQIWLPEGEFRLNNFVVLPSGYRVTSFTYGRTDLLKNPLKVSASDTDEFQLTLESTATPVKVSGRIEGVDLSTLANSPVRLTMSSLSFVQSLTTDVRSDGTFEFTSVLPASYQVHEGGEQQPKRILASINVGNKDITNLIVNFPK